MKSDYKKYIKAGVLILILLLAVKYWDRVAAVLYALAGAAFPLAAGGAVAYVVNILMSFYERHYFPASRKAVVHKSRRAVCMTGAFLTLAAVVSLVVVLILPRFIQCIELVIAHIPEVMSFIAEKLKGISYVPENIITSLSSTDWQSAIDKIMSAFTSGITNVMGVLVSTVTAVFSGIVTTLLSLIFAIYLLASKDTINRQADRVISHYLKPELYGRVKYVASVVNDSFHRYIVGQCTEAVILGILCTVGMMLLRLPYASMVGALIGFTALIPIAGAYIGAFVGAFMIFMVSPVQALVFLIFILILQQLEGNLIYPRVVGSSIGLPGIWVLAAVTVGGGVLGIGGMLVGVPLTAALYRIIRDDMNGTVTGGK
ncbi:MAG: AI-2E family transporter [Clostridia bacterium]|nr:AI-2E family transporter [Clostridia bacterium]